ncbi:MAG TPA: tetratricopeptide repeat protein [Bacteroidetes bacterium]|nr:tetratricopeptide repeat protein [Bacteroidota bacterium]
MIRVRSRFVIFGSVILFAALLLGCQSTYVRSAKIYLQQNDPENAKEVLLQGTEVTPQDPELWYILGKVYFDLREYPAMNDAFSKSLELSDQFAGDIKITRFEAWRLQFNAAVKPFNEKKYEEALKLFEGALSVIPDDPETLKRIGLCYIELENFDKAEEYLKRTIALDTDTTDVASRFNLMQLYWRQKRYEDVIRVADEILAMESDKLDDRKRLDTIQKKALSYQQLDRVDDSIQAWTDAIAQFPGNADFYYNRAILLHGQERYDEAAKDYMKVLEINPDDVEARMNVARALLALQHWDTLEEVLEPYLFPGGEVEVYETDITDMDPWLILRAAYENLGEKDKVQVVNKILINLQKAESGS